MGKKLYVHVYTIIEVDEKDLGQTIDKIVKILTEGLKCGAVRVNPDEEHGRVFVDAEFCYPLARSVEDVWTRKPRTSDR